MGSLKENFIKKFIMSLLWSVDKPEGSEKPEKSPENLENSDSKDGDEKSPEKESTEEREKSKSPVENVEDSDSDIEIVCEVKAPPKTSSISRPCVHHFQLGIPIEFTVRFSATYPLIWRVCFCFKNLPVCTNELSAAEIKIGNLR